MLGALPSAPISKPSILFWFLFHSYISPPFIPLSRLSINSSICWSPCVPAIASCGARKVGFLFHAKDFLPLSTFLQGLNQPATRILQLRMERRLLCRSCEDEWWVHHKTRPFAIYWHNLLKCIPRWHEVRLDPLKCKMLLHDWSNLQPNFFLVLGYFMWFSEWFVILCQYPFQWRVWCERCLMNHSQKIVLLCMSLHLTRGSCIE